MCFGISPHKLHLCCSSNVATVRANRTSEGQGALGSTIALTVLFGPLGLLKRGKDIDIPRGQEITAFVDAPISIPLPIAAAPAPE
jgi:hypothetical protein